MIFNSNCFVFKDWICSSFATYSAGHNVFSPFSTTTTTQEEKAAQIEQELKELNASDAELTANIHSLQADADELKSRITLLHTATRKLDTFLDELADEFTKESTALEDDESTEENLPVINHGFNILRLKKYDQDKLVQTLHTDILDQLDRTRHTLDSLSWLIKSDINRATVTLDEQIERTISMKDSLNAILSGLTGGIDTSVPIETLLGIPFSDIKTLTRNVSLNLTWKLSFQSVHQG